MSWLSKFVFDPVKASIARALTSSNPGVVAAATKANAVVQQTDATIAQVNAAGAGSLSINSAVALGSDMVTRLENGLVAALDAYIGGTLAATGPIGAVAAPEAIALANAALSFGEQHALTFISSLFSHGRTQLPKVAAPATIQAGGAPGKP